MYKISFIILAPLKGFKRGNKIILDIPRLLENITNIHKYFFKPEIIVVTGKYTNSYLTKSLSYRICENQLYENTGEVEQIRLGLNNCLTERIVILKEQAEPNYQHLKLLTKKHKDFITVGENANNPGMTFDKHRLFNIDYGLNNYFGDIMYIENNLKEIYSFVNNKDNNQKMMFELANYINNNKGLKVYENFNS